MDRRTFMLSAAASTAGFKGGNPFAALEQRAGGRLGVLALNTGNGQRIGHRVDERFAMCSTFKFLAAAALLKRVDRGAEHLDRRVTFDGKALLESSPVSEQHASAGNMTLEEACAAAVQWSDNSAANLLLSALGGPQQVTAFIRSTGDRVTHLDKIEPELNIVAPGEEHDTTTPASMVALLNSVVLGLALSSVSRQRLLSWMLDVKVGQRRLSAGVPAGWRVAHRTGTWGEQANDVGVIFPPQGAPLAEREGVLSEVARITTGMI